MILNLDLTDLDVDLEKKKKQDELKATEEFESQIKYFEYLKHKELQLEIIPIK